MSEDDTGRPLALYEIRLSLYGESLSVSLMDATYIALLTDLLVAPDRYVEFPYIAHRYSLSEDGVRDRSAEKNTSIESNRMLLELVRVRESVIGRPSLSG